MKQEILRKILAAGGALILILLSACSDKTAADFDWDDAVRNHLSSYHAEFSVEGPQEDPESGFILYTAKTQDENAISFTIVCSYARSESPLGGTRLIKEKRITDDFYQKVMDRISEQYGEKDLTDLSSEESVQYLIDAIARAREMAEAYHIHDVEVYGPKIRFTLTNRDRSWNTELSEMDETRFRALLLEKLGK